MKLAHVLCLLIVTAFCGCGVTQKIATTNLSTTTPPSITQTPECLEYKTPPLPKSWPQFQKGFFSVNYPSNFKNVTSFADTKTISKAEALDENTQPPDAAFFISPDKQAILYVYSPQWYGEPDDAWTNTTTEHILAAPTKDINPPECTVTKDDTFYTIQKQYTIVSNTGAYTRDVYDIIQYYDNAPYTRHTFAFQYTGKGAYTKYKDTFELFKSTLVQYAD